MTPAWHEPAAKQSPVATLICLATARAPAPPHDDARLIRDVRLFGFLRRAPVSRLSQNIATGRKEMGGPTVPRGRVRLRRHRVCVDEQALCATFDPRTRETASLPKHFAHSEFLSFVERRRSETASLSGPGVRVTNQNPGESQSTQSPR